MSTSGLIQKVCPQLSLEEMEDSILDANTASDEIDVSEDSTKLAELKCVTGCLKHPELWSPQQYLDALNERKY